MSTFLGIVDLANDRLGFRALAIEDRQLEFDRELRRVKHLAAEGGFEAGLVFAELRAGRIGHLQRCNAGLGADESHLHALHGIEIGALARRVQRRSLECLVCAVDLLHRAFEIHGTAALSAARTAGLATLTARLAGLGERLELSLVKEAVLVGVGAIEHALDLLRRHFVLRDLAVLVGVHLHHALNELRWVAAITAGTLTVLTASWSTRWKGSVLLGSGEGGEREGEREGERAGERAGEIACVGHDARRVADSRSVLTRLGARRPDRRSVRCE